MKGLCYTVIYNLYRILIDIVKILRSKQFIKMFACLLKDMITAQFSILILLVLLKYQRFDGKYCRQRRRILTFNTHRPFIKLSSPEQVFIMLESLFTLYDDTLVGDSLTSCVNDPIKIGFIVYVSWALLWHQHLCIP